ncbi:MAG: PEP-CTERM sorting domain-containing protein [Candidatus Hydrogenedentes bacterium]|nr:PEP-CTERM sorting domain-containing protein [Candidatus Hydrogenedentota bacterium]
MKKLVWGLVVACLLASGGVSATPITPTYDSFGALPAATFGGSGIPNDAVAISTWTDGTVTITLGLTATERYANPPVTDDGAGTYTALAGSDGGNAMWNFDYYIDIVGGQFDDFQFELLYDFDPAAGADSADLGVLDFNAAIVAAFGAGALSAVSNLQGSENLAFGYLDTPSAFINDPTYGPFSPTAYGEYSFALNVYDGATLLDTVAINVNTVPVPEPATMTMLGMGLGAFALTRMRKRRG